MGFIIHFILFLGLTYSPEAEPKLLFFCLFQCFTEKEYQTESKRNETFRNVIFSPNVIQETWTLLQEAPEEVTRVEGAPPWARPPTSWAPCCSTDVLLPPTYTYASPNDQNRSQKPNSTIATFCIREIPSGGLFRSSAGGGIYHGGLLHHHHSPSDEV